MPRKPKVQFKCQPMAELGRQLQFAPQDRRAEQLRRAESLHDTLDPDSSYPIDYVKFRITGLRAATPMDADDEPTLFVGQALLPDLRLIIDELSRSMPMDGGGDARPTGNQPSTADARGGQGAPDLQREPVETGAELAKRLGVSEKTIQRWRDRGLRWRWEMTPGSRQPRIVFPQRGVEAFLRRHGEQVGRASQFSQLDDAARSRIVARARRLMTAVNKPITLTRLTEHLAKRFGRSRETIRLLLEKHDRAHPDQPIIPDRTPTLTQRDKRLIVRAHAWMQRRRRLRKHLPPSQRPARSTITVTKIAQRFRHARSVVYRVIHQHQAKTIRDREIRFVHSPLFLRDDADAVILQPAPDHETPPADTDGSASDQARDEEDPADARSLAAAHQLSLPPHLRKRYGRPMLTVRRQSFLLLKMNYLKYKAHSLREQLDDYHPRVSDLQRIEDWLDEAEAIEAELRRANRAVILAVARQHLMNEDKPTLDQLVALLERGEPVLEREIAQFDVARKMTFRKHLRWELQRRFASETDDLR